MTIDGVYGPAAVALARGGIPVLQLRPSRKEPLPGSRGLLDATTDVATVAEWWERRPACNVGVRTGGAGGILIVDLDGDGAETRWHDLCKPHGGVPETRQSTTSRGRHFWFRIGDEGGNLRNSAGRLGAGIDVRAAGGYAVAPPSVHPTGARYEWANQAPIVRLPRWLLELLTPPPVPARAARPSRPPLAAGEITPEGQRRLRGAAQRLEHCGEGNRHHLLFWAACLAGELVAAGECDEQLARDVLYAAAEGCGLVDDEGAGLVVRTIADGLQRGSGS